MTEANQHNPFYWIQWLVQVWAKEVKWSNQSNSGFSFGKLGQGSLILTLNKKKYGCNLRSTKETSIEKACIAEITAKRRESEPLVKSKPVGGKNKQTKILKQINILLEFTLPILTLYSWKPRKSLFWITQVQSKLFLVCNWRHSSWYRHLY